MKGTVYVVAHRYGIDKVNKTRPASINAAEYLVEIDIEIPDAVFTTPKTPIIKVVLPPSQVGTANVTVNGVDQPQSVSSAASKQAVIQRELAEIMQSARRSPDTAMQERADKALLALVEAGVEVRLAEDEPQSDTAEENRQ